MTATVPARNDLPTSAARTFGVTVGAGVIAGMVMAMWAMIASTFKDRGFFTPLYHIASLWASPNTMTASMQDAMTGSQLHFAAGPALLGAMIHMMTGAMYGVLFVLLVQRVRLSAPALIGTGMMYGIAVFAISSYVVLPLAASIFGSGDPIRHMPRMAGWGTFFVEHLMFGVALGVLAALLHGKVRTVVDHERHH